jgi:N-acetylmuramoyl-L-alanine amidase
MRATSNMPTVLVELGFITNANDERRLRDQQHQRTMAKAIATAIRRYLDEKQERLNALLGGR